MSDAFELAGISDPALVAVLVAADPFGLGGVALRARVGPWRERWLADLRELLPAAAPLRRLPLHAGDSRLFGGLDLAATLVAGRPVAERGLLAESDGGLLLLAMAERISGPMAARLGAVLDSGEVILERDGFAARSPARIGMVALDEGIEPDERPPSSLLEHLAFWLDLDGFEPLRTTEQARSAVTRARRLAPGTQVPDAIVEALVGTTLAFGIASLRAPILTLRAARIAAALEGRSLVDARDAALAARLVLAPRATRLPVAPEAEPESPPDRPADDGSGPRPDSAERDPAEPGPPSDPALGDIVLAATRAAVPPGLLAQLQGGDRPRSGRAAPGRAGALSGAPKRGRPAGTRRGHPADGARLNVIETLRAAAPWQRIRAKPGVGEGDRRVEIRRDDLRVTRLKQRTETVTIFAVDASGSLATNRLAEAKGAVELLLADCYVRRDQVALLAFRGRIAELLLPPTRSLARAKRSLADLPGGGSTPLATAIDAAMLLAGQVRRRGQTPLVVFLTDGRANVARDGSTGRVQAEQDAALAGRAAAATGISLMVVDAGPRPQPAARALAQAMGALYVPLPRVEAGALSQAIRSLAA